MYSAGSVEYDLASLASDAMLVVLEEDLASACYLLL
jgi:hypothetical protein